MAPRSAKASQSTRGGSAASTSKRAGKVANGSAEISNVRDTAYSTSNSTASSSVTHSDLDDDDDEMKTAAGQGSTVNHDGDGLDEDMRTAIAALGIMRRGGSSNGGVSTTATPSLQQDSFSSSGQASTSYTVSSNAAARHQPSWNSSAVDGQLDSSSTSSITSSSSSSAADLLSQRRRASSSVATSEDTMEDDLGNDLNASASPSNEATSDPKFISRVSQLPLVSGGIEWYERSKASSRVVKYGAGLVESSISTISRPITNQLGGLDEFACRQLDRFGPGASPSTQELPLPEAESQQQFERLGTSDVEMVRPTPRRASKSFTRNQQYDADDVESTQQLQLGTQQAVAEGRSRWQTVLVEAGGIGAAVSEESLKSLRYCLQWLLYATAHLDHQIATLRDFIASLHSHASTRDGSGSDALVTASASAHLSQIKHDVVETIRKVVDVVSKYAGVALPEQAKRYVRQSILGLPVKWASAIEGTRGLRAQSVDSTHSAATTPRAERMEDPYASSSNGASTSTTLNESGTTGRAPLAPTEDAAERILTFAVESLDMLRSVTGIFSDSVARAEDWIEKLRIIGLDRQRRRQQAGDSGETPSMPPPALLDGTTSAAGQKRRRTVGGDGQELEGSSTAVESNGFDLDEGIVRRKRGPRSRETTMSLE